MAASFLILLGAIIGAGFAGTFNVADRGFIDRLNDSVGVGFAANWLSNHHFILSAAMQWNFWFTERWSAFGLTVSCR